MRWYKGSTTCRRGHDLTLPGATFIADKNRRKCKVCDSDRQKRYRKQDPERYAMNVVRRQQVYKNQAFDVFGRRCNCCGETEVAFLTLDHINGGGKAHLRKRSAWIWLDVVREGFPKDKYQILCQQCNWAKGVYGICPHELKRRQQQIAVA